MKEQEKIFNNWFFGRNDKNLKNKLLSNVKLVERLKQQQKILIDTNLWVVFREDKHIVIEDINCHTFHIKTIRANAYILGLS